MARKNALLDVLGDAYVRGMARNVNALAEIAGKPFPDPRVYARGAEFVPGVGDAVGLGQDVRGYAESPNSLTPLNGLLSLAGLLPAIPSGLKDAGFSRLVFHKSNKAIDKFDPYLHVGTLEQADMRAAGNGANILPLAMKDPGYWPRVRDNGNLQPKDFKKAQRAGAKGVVYLNRYEGIPQSEFQALWDNGIDPDKLSDAEFRRLVPSAKDSYVIFDPAYTAKSIYESP